VEQQLFGSTYSSAPLKDMEAVALWEQIWLLHWSTRSSCFPRAQRAAARGGWSSGSLGAYTYTLEHAEQLLIPRARTEIRYSCSTGARGAAAFWKHTEQLCYSAHAGGSSCICSQRGFAPAEMLMVVTSQLAESQLAECLYVGLRNRVRARDRG